MSLLINCELLVVVSTGSFSDEVCLKFDGLVMDKTLKMSITNIDVHNNCCVHLVEENLSNTISKVDVASTLVQAGLAAACKAPSEKGNFIRRCWQIIKFLSFRCLLFFDFKGYVCI